MDYFRSYTLSADVSVVAAWESETARAREIPSLARLIAERGAELYPEFVKRYAEVRALSRSARRALQRRLAASRDLTAIPAEWRRRLAYSIAGAALLLVLSDGPLKAATINVGPGCTLRDAILSANRDTQYGSCTPGASGLDTIVIPAKSKIVLTNILSIDYGSAGLPTVTSPITVTGNFASISRSKKGPAMRLITVAGNGDLTLNNLTLSAGYSYYGGGAIYNAGILEVNNCIISGNAAYSGAVATSGTGTTTISGTTFTKNVAYNGGAVYNQGQTDILDSTVTGNRAFSVGGGLYNYNGSMSVQNSTLSKNSANDAGGAIANYNGAVSVDPTIITGNKAALGGGIANAYGYVYVSDSTISKNSAIIGGGGIANIGGNGSAPNGPLPTLIVTNSTVITGNKSSTLGGGIFNCGRFILDDSTISGNSAKAGGGIANVHGYKIGLSCFFNTDYENNPTIAGNKAKVGADYFEY